MIQGRGIVGKVIAVIEAVPTPEYTRKQREYPDISSELAILPASANLLTKKKKSSLNILSTVLVALKVWIVVPEVVLSNREKL